MSTTAEAAEKEKGVPVVTSRSLTDPITVGAEACCLATKSNTVWQRSAATWSAGNAPDSLPPTGDLPNDHSDISVTSSHRGQGSNPLTSSQAKG
jgi:hypothetical protein